MIPARLRDRIAGRWEERPSGFCLSLPADQIHAAAHGMHLGGARFVALTVRPLEGGALQLRWYWDLEGVLLTLEAPLEGAARAQSIVDLYPGADWAEREARDYYAVAFTGRASTPPLMLREGDEPGVLLREKGSRP